ncbi:restriction endonuclease subunit S [Flavobacterium psychrophilum]|uniref:restriction endonuclease subunit S n=1 Tax=Flavobacterium psychrophilum TaxID=96345 RepID=UPI001C8F4EB3|nr:restriction endonuclease subunit S [Flavobacterium psychrophilum]QZK99527.1 restriction endonuclease subunit S [Flavobacterium psychrophilum]
MKSSYKKLGQYIRIVDERNKNLEDLPLMGLSVQKKFFPTIANLIGTDMSTYKIVYKNQFTYIADTSRRGDKIAIALNENFDKMLVSQAYTPFEVIDKNELLPEYLMMWFRRPEFDRYARFKSHGSAREIFGWDEMCDTELPIPSIEKQKEIVKEYHILVNRIDLNNQLITKLEETAQAIYKQWFVDFEFPDEKGLPYKSNGGEMVWCEELDKEIPVGWRNGKLGDLAIIIMGQSPTTESYNTDGNGMVFYQGRTEFGYRFPAIKNFTSEPKRKAKAGDILMSVRAPVGDLNIANQDCSIGRGVASLKSKIKCNSFLFYSIQSIKQQFDVSNGEGTIYGSITKDGLNDIQVIKPNDNIVLEYEKITKELDKNIENYSKQNNIVVQTKDLVLSKMATIEN